MAKLGPFEPFNQMTADWDSYVSWFLFYVDTHKMTDSAKQISTFIVCG